MVGVEQTLLFIESRCSMWQHQLVRAKLHQTLTCENSSVQGPVSPVNCVTPIESVFLQANIRDMLEHPSTKSITYFLSSSRHCWITQKRVAEG